MSTEGFSEYISSIGDQVSSWTNSVDGEGMLNGIVEATTGLWKSITDTLSSVNVDISTFTNFIGGFMPSEFQTTFNNLASGLGDTKQIVADLKDDVVDYIEGQMNATPPSGPTV